MIHENKNCGKSGYGIGNVKIKSSSVNNPANFIP